MANISKVDLSRVNILIDKELRNYQQKVHVALVETCEQGIKKAKKEIEKDFKSQLKGNKGEGGKHYRSTFTTRKKSDTSRFLWNRQYQLSHLLEDGHYVYNQHGGAYNIHPQWPLIWGIKSNGDPIIYGSEYGTEGKVTIAFKSWDYTEKKTAEYVEKELLKKLK